IVNLVRSYARIGERDEAMERLNDLAQLQPTGYDVRNQVADAMYQADYLEIAGLLFAQVLAQHPSNQQALVDRSRVFIRSHQPCQARKVLEGFRPDESALRIYYLTVAEYYQRVGEYTEAKSIYSDFLRRDESDSEVRLALGAMYGAGLPGLPGYLRECE